MTESKKFAAPLICDDLNLSLKIETNFAFVDKLVTILILSIQFQVLDSFQLSCSWKKTNILLLTYDFLLARCSYSIDDFVFMRL